MRISYFREFIVLAKCLNFSLAARQLNMTQPGLSRHISSLENELSVKLFKRDTHQVRLTENGEQFLSGIEKIIDDYDFLCESVSKNGLQKITIGVPYYGVKRYLSHVTGPFKTAYPNVKIDYLPSYPDEIFASLMSMRVDVAVLPKVDYPAADRLIFQEAFRESAVLMLSQDHHLAGQSGVHIDALKNEKFISLRGSFGVGLNEGLFDFFQKRGFPRPVTSMEVDSIEAAALNIKPDAGMMPLPGHLKEANISGNVKFIDVLDDDFYLTICLVRHPANTNPMIEKFVNYYMSHGIAPQ